LGYFPYFSVKPASMQKEHHYRTLTEWTGNLGSGTSHYAAYTRNHTLSIAQKAHEILGSSDPSFRGDPSRYNPEELLVASLSACHMLWYLHLCSVNNVVVLDYRDEAEGTMIEGGDGGGRFKEVILHPRVKVADAGMIDMAKSLHAKANQLCFIANSCNFPVRHEGVVEVE
jgi:organic hydroperoxide reductase OsmC/OhrA